MTRTTTALATVAVAAALAAGCGSTSSSSYDASHGSSAPVTHAPAVSDDQQQISQVWRTAESAMARGDYAAFKATLTPQAAVIVDSYGGASLMAQGKPATLASIKVNGDTAKTTTRQADGTIKPAVFVKTGDGWRISIDMSSSTDQSAGPSAQTAQAWPAKWCKASVGMTSAQLHAVMGSPTDETLTGTSPQASWSAYEYQFNAFYGADGTVRQLDINDSQLSAREKASLGCATTRTR
jgi:hypothetical protein